MRQNVTKSLLLSDRPTVTADQPKTQRQDCLRAIGLQLLFPLVSITEYLALSRKQSRRIKRNQNILSRDSLHKLRY